MQSQKENLAPIGDADSGAVAGRHFGAWVVAKLDASGRLANAARRGRFPSTRSGAASPRAAAVASRSSTDQVILNKIAAGSPPPSPSRKAAQAGNGTEAEAARNERKARAQKLITLASKCDVNG